LNKDKIEKDIKLSYYRTKKDDTLGIFESKFNKRKTSGG